MCVSGAACISETTIRTALRGLRCTHLLCVLSYTSRTVAPAEPPNPHILPQHCPCRCTEPDCAGEASRGGFLPHSFRSTYNDQHQRAPCCRFTKPMQAISNQLTALRCMLMLDIVSFDTPPRWGRAACTWLLVLLSLLVNLA